MNAAAALRAKTGVAHGVARGALETAAKLRQLPLVSEAFSAGEVTRRKAEIVTKACTPERAGAFSEREAALVDAARVATPRAFAQIVARVSDAIDGDDGASCAWQKYQRRRLHVSKTLDAMVVGDFALDPDDGDLFLRSMSAMQRQDSPKGDARRPEQKRADAFMGLVRTGAAHAAAGSGRHRREFVVPIDLSEIDARGGRAIAEDMRVHAPDLPKATRRRLLCDCKIARVITDGPSQVSTPGARRAPCRRRPGVRSSCVTAGARSWVVTGRRTGVTPIMCGRGRTVGRPISATSCCRAVGTTEGCSRGGHDPPRPRKRSAERVT